MCCVHDFIEMYFLWQKVLLMLEGNIFRDYTFYGIKYNNETIQSNRK